MSIILSKHFILTQISCRQVTSYKAVVSYRESSVLLGFPPIVKLLDRTLSSTYVGLVYVGA